MLYLDNDEDVRDVFALTAHELQILNAMIAQFHPLQKLLHTLIVSRNICKHTKHNLEPIWADLTFFFLNPLTVSYY